MKNFLKNFYNIEMESLLKISNKAYKINSEQGQFVIKVFPNNSQESLFGRIAMQNLQVFLLPIKSKNDRYIEEFENQYYALFPYLKDEETLAKDIRLNFYVKSIAALHQITSYNIRVADAFFEESLNYLDIMIKEQRELLTTRIERVEHNEYHSPADWFFLMNYNHFNNALNEAGKYVDSLEEEWKKASSLHLCLTYQNFDYQHILVRQQKIISLEKMAIAPSIYDIIMIINEAFSSHIDSIYLLKDYLSIHRLEPFEINWLLAFLFIPKLKRCKDDIEDLTMTNEALSFLLMVENITTNLLKGLTSYTQKELEEQPKESG